MSTFPNGKNPTIRIPDPVGVRDLATALGEKVFKIMADILEVGQFQNIHGAVRFRNGIKDRPKAWILRRKDQLTHRASLDAAMTPLLHSQHHWRRASERGR